MEKFLLSHGKQKCSIILMFLRQKVSGLSLKGSLLTSGSQEKIWLTMMLLVFANEILLLTDSYKQDLISNKWNRSAVCRLHSILRSEVNASAM